MQRNTFIISFRSSHEIFYRIRTYGWAVHSSLFNVHKKLVNLLMLVVNQTTRLSSKQTNVRLEEAACTDGRDTLSFSNDEPQTNICERIVSSFNINICMQFAAIIKLRVECCRGNYG